MSATLEPPSRVWGSGKWQVTFEIGDRILHYEGDTPQEAIADALSDVPVIAGAHHEKVDGSGYPQGLKGEAIPLGARILKVVDVYGAVTEDRPYRSAYSHEDAITILKQGVKTEFDPKMVTIFLQLLARKAIHTAYD